MKTIRIFYIYCFSRMQNISAFLILLVFISCGNQGTKSVLLLKSGFEEGVSISDDMTKILGGDVPGYSWNGNASWIKGSNFVYIVKSDSLREFQESVIETTKGHDGNETRVLRIINKKDCPVNPQTSRTEFSFFGKTAPDDYKEGYVRYWMKLQDNLPQLVDYSGETPNPIQISQNDQWYMILEWKEISSGLKFSAGECAAIGGASGGTNNYRINIGLHKFPGKDELCWQIVGQQVQPCRITEWEYFSSEKTVPVGKWFMVEAYMKKDSIDGRVYFAVNGEVILDTDVYQPEGFTGRTQHAANPLKLGFWSPMKSYHDMRWNNKGPVSQWYDDFELWSSFPPDHPALSANTVPVVKK